MEDKSQRYIIGWLLSGCGLIFLMVLVGGITRLTHSGLSMVEWNLIMGALPPLTEADWQVTFEKYQATPEFQKVNSEFILDEFKAIFWWEYIHRMLGRLIGVVFLIPFLYFLMKRWLSKPLTKKLLFLLFLGGFQGFLGWYMVKSGLVNDPAVSHYRLAAHLITAFITFGYTFWVALGLFFSNDTIQQENRSIGKWSVGLLFAVTLQVIYGAFVAGLRGGLVYNTFPKMGNDWFPDTMLSLEPVWANFVGSPVGTQWVHRWLAVLVVVLVLVIWKRSLPLKLTFSQRIAVNGTLLTVLLQFILGVLTLLQAVPIHLGVMHQLGAFALFAFSVLMAHRFNAFVT